ncbi:hypothetical protein BT69DRAFT_1289599, partial [Atractiella rhizophila]
EPDTDDEGESSTAATSLDTLVQQKQYAPFVNGVFGGKLNSFIICDECKHVGSSSCARCETEDGTDFDDSRRLLWYLSAPQIRREQTSK